MKILLNFVPMIPSAGRRMASRLRGLLAYEDWVYLLSLLVPLLVYNVALKVVRIATQLNVPGPLGFADQLRSDVFFNLGYAALWIGLFVAVRGRFGRAALLAAFHLACLLLPVLTTAAHFYYKTTGSTLDYSLIVLTLTSFEEIRGVIASEMTGLHWGLLSAVLFYGIAGPAVAVRLASGDWHVPVWAEGPSRPRGAWRPALATCLAAGAFVLLSALPSATGVGNYFARDAIVNMVLNEVATARIEEPQVVSSVSVEDLPTDTRLVPTPRAEKRNVVLVFLESVRARSATPYNPELETTPFLDELAEDSLMAENAYAVVPHTSKSMVAAHCGVEPPLDTKMTESEPDAIPARCLPELLEEQGYSTVFFQSATENFERRRALVANFGYEEFYPLESMDTEGHHRVNYFGYEDDIMLEPSRRWLEEHRDGPFMATYLTVTSHHDYNVPPDFETKEFSDKELVNRYQNTVHYQDAFLKKLFEQYKELGLYDETVFVVMADHGEGFGEHGLYQHDNTIYNEGIKIPLLFHDPRRFEGGRVVETPVQNLSVLPTVVDLLGYRIEGGEYRGRSLLDPLEPRPLKVSCWVENRCLALIDGDEKYIYHFGHREEEYFDLSEDPLEKDNIIGRQREERIDRLRNELLFWEAYVRAMYEQHIASLRQEETTATPMEGTSPAGD
ncbi:sulfatase [Rubrobacter xylanophilus DSM 9941]|uniref:Sulfatase n=1 Tax=Rubrobacter xylanophilus (strain DSM 9941 / JCM 11954 / NBRC 16129 / PRD-1) TaxID=266117 RepID=Q1AXQ7_RUBXD|nr:sulfatase-like hydrolase/transferase [Rubrobacter xylanophilus]ABG03821.1 sulfatase [Rubrobacter xylanophilus DSM 9941]